MAHPSIDDLGNVLDPMFWNSLTVVTLESIESGLMAMLTPGNTEENEELERYIKLSRSKFDTIEKFRLLAGGNNDLVEPTAQLQKEMLAPEFLPFFNSHNVNNLKSIMKQPTDGVYTFPLFTNEFCTQLLGVMDAYEKLPPKEFPRRRPNTYGASELFERKRGAKRRFSLPRRFAPRHSLLAIRSACCYRSCS